MGLLTGNIHTEIDIDASPDAVWAVLADGGRYADWNPFITQLDGELKAGGKLTMTAKPPGHSGGTFKPTLLTVAPGKELRWRGSLPIPGLFVGEHYFVLEPSAAGKTHLIHGENFKGLLVPMVGVMLKATKVGFSEMNSALKKRVEAAAAAK